MINQNEHIEFLALIYSIDKTVNRMSQLYAHCMQNGIFKQRLLPKKLNVYKHVHGKLRGRKKCVQAEFQA